LHVDMVESPPSSAISLAPIAFTTNR